MPTHYLYVKQNKMKQKKKTHSPDSAAEIEGSSPWNSLFLFVRSLLLALSIELPFSGIPYYNKMEAMYSMLKVGYQSMNAILNLRFLEPNVHKEALQIQRYIFEIKEIKAKKKKIPYLIYGILNTLGNNSYFRRCNKPENYD